MTITTDAITSFVIAALAQIRHVDRVERESDDSARVVLKNGQTFTVAVIHGQPRDVKEQADAKPAVRRNSRTY